MKYLNSQYYVEVKDHRQKILSTENKKLRKRDPQLSLKFKTVLRLGKIRKLLEMLTMN